MKYLFLYIVLLCSACASINPLDGGLKDEQAPIVLASFPDSAQLNVNTNEIRIRFDEYVSAKNMRDLLIISPSLENDPETEIKKKTLYIRFNDTLRSNTTYSVLLNGSIVDYNEGNVLENYQLSFSTGDYLDSLQYKAKIIDVFSKEACTDCLLALYISAKDSAPLLQKPVYLGRANNGGVVKITNLAAGNYQAIAIKDANKNLKLDDLEYISLYKELQLTDSTEVDSFYTFPFIAQSTNKASLVRSYPGVVTLAFERAVDTSLKVIHKNESITFTLNTTRDTLRTYINASQTDSFSFSVWLDTTEQKLLYTLNDLPKYFGVTSIRKKTHTIQLKAKQQIHSFKLKRIKLLIDSNTYDFDSAQINGNKLLLHSSKLNAQNCKVLLLDSSIQDYNFLYNLKDTQQLGAYIAPDTKLSVDVKLQQPGAYIFQVLLKGEIKHQTILHASNKLEFSDLKAGTYRIRIIKDDNQNMIWDTGDFLSNKPAESVFLSELIELRSNWDKELSINY